MSDSRWAGVPLEEIPRQFLDAEVWRRYRLAPLEKVGYEAGERIELGAVCRIGPDGRVYNAAPDPRLGIEGSGENAP